ncbi:hypothetical protein [Alicyclobacillus pomorum]|nr:hypothetical protein [Alicyclobacillus pomorum]
MAEREKTDMENEETLYCPICNSPLNGETRECTPFCSSCGYKGVCGDPTS